MLLGKNTAMLITDNHKNGYDM